MDDTCERLTEQARGAVQRANEEAKRFGHKYIQTGDLLLGLVSGGSNTAVQILEHLKIDRSKLAVRIEQIIQAWSSVETDPRLKKVVEYAFDEAQRLKHRHVGTEHLLLGLLREREGVAALSRASGHLLVTTDFGRPPERHGV